MICMHCLVSFHPEEKIQFIGVDADGGWGIYRYDCPSCNRMNLFLVNGRIVQTPKFARIVDVNHQIPIRPFGSNRPPCPVEVPEVIAIDYREACVTLPISPKASAALSRRCLQNLLRETVKVKPNDLANEIQEVLDRGGLPAYIAHAVDAIRQIGNFAAHPLKSRNTGEILPVEPEEAEWNLDVLESLFDFYFVQPTILQKKRDGLNVKLQEAGKPPLK